MLHVGFLLQLSEAICCTSIFSCNFRRCYIARRHSLATSRGNMLHVSFVLQHPGAICCTWALSCNIQGQYVARELRLATFGASMLHVDLLLQLSRALFCILLISTITFLLINTKIKKGFIRRFSPNG